MSLYLNLNRSEKNTIIATIQATYWCNAFTPPDSFHPFTTVMHHHKWSSSLLFLLGLMQLLLAPLLHVLHSLDQHSGVCLCLLRGARRQCDHWKAQQADCGEKVLRLCQRLQKEKHLRGCADCVHHVLNRLQFRKSKSRSKDKTLSNVWYNNSSLRGF